MKTPNNILDESIQMMETKRDLELIQIKLELHELFESLKPMNIIKDTISKVTTSPDLKQGIGKTAVGVASGILVKKILFRGTHNPLKTVARTLLQIAATGFAAKNADKMKTAAQKLFYGLVSKIKR